MSKILVSSLHTYFWSQQPIFSFQGNMKKKKLNFVFVLSPQFFNDGIRTNVKLRDTFWNLFASLLVPIQNGLHAAYKGINAVAELDFVIFLILAHFPLLIHR